MASQIFPKVKNESSESGGSESGADEKGGNNDSFEYFGWVYHLGVNSIGHEYCHLRFLYIRGKYMEMYKRDPHENPGTRISKLVGGMKKVETSFDITKNQRPPQRKALHQTTSFSKGLIGHTYLQVASTKSLRI